MPDARLARLLQYPTFSLRIRSPLDSTCRSRYSSLMQHNTRYLARPIDCACRQCSGTGTSWRRFVKQNTRRAVRRTEALEIQKEINEHNDHNGDADYLMHTMKLSRENLQNLRTLDSYPITC